MYIGIHNACKFIRTKLFILFYCHFSHSLLMAWRKSKLPDEMWRERTVAAKCAAWHGEREAARVFGTLLKDKRICQDAFPLALPMLGK